MRNPETIVKIFVALGPGDIVGVARSRTANLPIPGTSISYSEQIFSYCKAVNIKTLGISSHSRPDRFRDGIISIENKPKLFQDRGPILFHLSAVYYSCYLAFRARRFGAELAIIDSGTTHYFLLTLFPLLGIRVAVNLHNVLWPVGFPPQKKARRVLKSLDAWFFRNIVAGAIGVSPECERQILSESRRPIPFFQYRCQFLSDGFCQSKPYKSGSFYVACVGRIEEPKGFLDIAKIARDIRIKSHVPIVFHVCGDGSAIRELRQIIQRNALTDNVIIHGHLQRDDLLRIYASSHAVIVPTRSTFGEGLPAVCAEAMLSGLPVITTPVANVSDVIGPATLQAETDNIESYVNAILTLINDRELYEKLRTQCHAYSKQFLDPSQGCAAAVNRLVMALFPKWT